MEDIVAGLGPELTEAEQEAIQQHLEQCELCRAQFRRMGLIVRYLSAAETEPPTGEPHLSDVDLAAFAHARFGAEDAGRIIEHLNHCPECRQVLAAARLAMDDYEQQQSRPGLSWEELHDELKLAFSTPQRAAHLLGAVVAYLAECVLFAVALGQLILGYAVAGPDYWAVPDFWPLRVVPAGPARLWALVVICTALGFVARHLAARFCRQAMDSAAGGWGRP